MACSKITASLDSGRTLSGALCGFGSINGQLSTRGRSTPPYGGSYEVTPSGEAQVLPTSSRVLLSDITINPIPSNYGLITWDGSTLMVS